MSSQHGHSAAAPLRSSTPCRRSSHSAGLEGGRLCWALPSGQSSQQRAPGLGLPAALQLQTPCEAHKAQSAKCHEEPLSRVLADQLPASSLACGQLPEPPRVSQELGSSGIAFVPNVPNALITPTFKPQLHAWPRDRLAKLQKPVPAQGRPDMHPIKEAKATMRSEAISLRHSLSLSLS